MQKTRILLIDDDPVCRTVVKQALEDRGHAVTCASDGEEGLRLADSVKPDLVITDVEMPRVDGWRVVERLRARREFALTPVIMFTVRARAHERLRGFSLGADDFIPKDALTAEVALRVDNALARRVAPSALASPPGSGTADVQGSLGQIGLASLMQLLDMDARSGVLELSDGTSRGSMKFREGRVVAASIVGADDLVGNEAVFALLCWRSGEFKFRAGAVSDADSIGLSTTAILLDVARRFDEWR